ncbi:MAG: IS1634 family transposase [Nitrosomonadales bacterium]|nr:IS1634 family transposase [Nitrosomonadales bacterium]
MVVMYIDKVPNRHSPPAILLRESFREGKKVRKRTLGNLSSLPPYQIELIRHVLRGERLTAVEDHFEIVASFHHGHVDAVLRTMERLGFAQLIASAPSRERDLVLGMVAARIIEPDSKLATTRWWHTTTLPAEFGVADADEDDLYDAMDWLLKRQPRIEAKLAARHLKEGGLVLFDLTSSYFEGVTCPLAALGKSRDGKKGTLQVNWGLLTDERGRPVAVSVFKGNTGDPTTLLPQVRKVKDDFGIKTLVIVGDRGMITQTQIDEIKGLDGVDWITALKSAGIKKLMEGEALQMELFDERNLFEMTHPDYPGERLVACLNPELRKLRGHKRRSLLDATSRELEKVRTMVQRGRFKGKDKAEIGVKVGKVINKYKMAKHVVLDIRDGFFDFHVDEKKVEAEAALDGIYVIRTSLDEGQASAEDAVRHYKKLVLIEAAYRSLKTIDIKTRPIRHYTEDRVRAHIFLCMLAYYVEWHMREAWRSLLFCDEDQEAKKTRDPVAPAKRSEAALEKVHEKVLDDGTAVHSFQTLLKCLSAIVRNICRVPRVGPDAPTFEVVTTPNAKQQRAYKLLERLEV